MKARFLFLIMVSFVVLWSCEPNEPDSVLINNAPVLPSQTFTVPENFPDGQLIGKIQATDKDKDALEFSLIQESSGLFEVAKNGNLFLAAGKTLSYAVQEEHVLDVYVHDGVVGRKGTLTIKVIQEDPENQPPLAENQEFEVNEDIADDEVIGTVVATDPEEDDLTFLITENDDDLFILSDTGELTLVEGAVLDFETKEDYTLTITVGDGVNVPVEITLSINVLDVNEAPIAEDRVFDDIIETLPEGELIGNLEATDPEGEPLTYEIVEDEDGLFAVTGNGEVVLAEGQSLDFETAEQHTIVVSISDGVNEVQITVTINVLDDGDIFDDPASFITTWNVETDGQELIIGTNPDFSYDYTIDWGDGTIEQRTDQNPSHVYENADTYTVAINGQFPAIMMNQSNLLSQGALIDVVQWGTQQWQSMEYAFIQCVNLENFGDNKSPDLSQVKSMEGMFAFASTFNGDISQWDVSNVTNMKNVFLQASSFNGDLSGWNVGNVTNMVSMFDGAINFNSNIGGWVVTNVTNMVGMFNGADSFNQDIGGWVVGNVENMSGMFNGAASFNQDISGWDVREVTDMFVMFAGAVNFNQNLGVWEIFSMQNMVNMFNNSGMSTLNYSATLRGWASLGNENIPDGVNLGASEIPYCNDFETISARESILANNNGWNITDGGSAPCF
ncbi:BspA family leucine-rich repeat surface protein [Flagellimonas marinaquae]|uniref:BspA family leucine-rich repeat surface protein n=1 Tax=Flagellimonas marinaquae TaxID=254955 RepID=UPI000F8C543C|nr:BspA family leucine-rich repeat surface protein [Allomuricauda aquimarina]